MTNSDSDQQSAAELLQQRTDGYSLRRIFGKMKSEHIVYLALAVGTLISGLMRQDSIFIGISGFFVGFLVRDFHWLRAGKSQWQFASRVIDWAKVERMADVHLANAKEEANKS